MDLNAYFFNPSPNPLKEIALVIAAMFFLAAVTTFAF